MLIRFCLYGFLKNQRYFEPFLYLAFIERGLSFTDIGLLIAFRELVVILLEIPSGAIADVTGRRRSMLLSFVAYIISFLLFASATSLPSLAVGMLCFGIGDSFRTGTHKAMIFAWLRIQGRENERTKIYGITRSWSKFGSAASAVIAALFVVVTDSFDWIFYAATIPYVLSIVNIMGYPKDLESKPAHGASLRAIGIQLKCALKDVLNRAGLRRLAFESMGFEGVFHAVKDYLQPVLKAVAVAWGASMISVGELSDTQRTAILAAPVFTILHVISGIASRRSHLLVERLGSEDRAAKRLWMMAATLYAALTFSAFMGWHGALVLCLVLLPIIQNIWRPILIARFDSHSEESRGATTLSIESQARRVSTMILAPCLGLSVDWATRHHLGQSPYWPLGIIGFVSALTFVFIKSPSSSTADK